MVVSWWWPFLIDWFKPGHLSLFHNLWVKKWNTPLSINPILCKDFPNNKFLIQEVCCMQCTVYIRTLGANNVVLHFPPKTAVQNPPWPKRVLFPHIEVKTVERRENHVFLFLRKGRKLWEANPCSCFLWHFKETVSWKIWWVLLHINR